MLSRMPRKTSKNPGDPSLDTASKSPKNGKARRPHRDPSIDWQAIENAYVWGDTIGQRPDGSYLRSYPTLKKLGEKFNVIPTLIHYHAKRGNWQERRLACQQQTQAEFDAELAKARARETVDALGVLNRWLRKFDENVRAGKVRADSIADLNTVMRLQKFLEGGGADRVQHDVRITLEQLQQRHQQLRGRVLAAAGDVAGELAASDGDPLAGEVVESVGEEGAHEGEARETP